MLTTNPQLQELLSLKQQQASIIEARMSLKRADLSLEQQNLSIQQGRSIMLFTIVTIFFLPLSFFTGIFGMNNVEWESDPLSIHQQFRFMRKSTTSPILPSDSLVLLAHLIDMTHPRSPGLFYCHFRQSPPSIQPMDTSLLRHASHDFLGRDHRIQSIALGPRKHGRIASTICGDREGGNEEASRAENEQGEQG